jgi:hypothetical protein
MSSLLVLGLAPSPLSPFRACRISRHNWHVHGIDYQLGAKVVPGCPWRLERIIPSRVCGISVDLRACTLRQVPRLIFIGDKCQGLGHAFLFAKYAWPCRIVGQMAWTLGIQCFVIMESFALAISEKT